MVNISLSSPKKPGGHMALVKTGYTEWRACGTCKGESNWDCTSCDGSGRRKAFFGGEKECSACDGSGRQHCRSCDGDGGSHEPIYERT